MDICVVKTTGNISWDIHEFGYFDTIQSQTIIPKNWFVIKNNLKKIIDEFNSYNYPVKLVKVNEFYGKWEDSDSAFKSKFFDIITKMGFLVGETFNPRETWTDTDIDILLAACRSALSRV
jgi:ABC-type sulfate transport system substrate-binding protein